MSVLAKAQNYKYKLEMSFMKLTLVQAESLTINKPYTIREQACIKVPNLVIQASSQK
jgi:hypothetical protein